jgi:hypothetical protein
MDDTFKSKIFASMYFSPGDPDEFLLEFWNIAGCNVGGYHAISLDRFNPKEPQLTYIIGYKSCEIFGPIVYAMIKKHGIECLRKHLVGQFAFLHLKKIRPYSELAEKAMKKAGFDTEEKVKEYLKSIDLKSIPIFKIKFLEVPGTFKYLYP